MTVIAGFTYAIFSILVADSRLTAFRPRTIRRDVAQKMFPLGDVGIISFAGGLDAARFVIERMEQRRVREGPWWLFDKEEARTTLRKGYDPADFPEPRVSFIAQLINPTRKAFEHEDTPRVDMIVIDVEPFRHEVVPYGTRVRGSGNYIIPRIEEDNLFLAVATFSSAWPDFERAVINKALFGQEMVEQLIRERYEPTVGGLYQVAYILPDRVRVLSYERWISANGDEAHGTYVRLRVDGGSWWQEHDPTYQRIKLENPFVSRVEDDFTKDLLFDASLFTPLTPGVVKTPNPLRISSFLSAHGVAERPLTKTARPASDKPFGPDGTFQRIGPNPGSCQAIEE